MNGFILILYTYALFSVSQGLDIYEGIDKAPQSLLEYLDDKINPCDNLYKFSCGHWIKNQERIYGNDKDIIMNSSIIKFNTFVKEFEEGKLNDQSKAINSIYNLRRRCNELPAAEIAKCQSDIFEFGKYALGVVFINNIRTRSRESGALKKLDDMVARIKEEFRLLIDEKKDILSQGAINYLLFKLDRMLLKQNNYFDKDFYLVAMHRSYDGFLKKFESKSIQYILDYISNMDNETFFETYFYLYYGKELKSNKNYLSQYVYTYSYYNAEDNIFTINQDSLNEPSFSIYYPMSLNYGYLGAIVGNEIAHAFDGENYHHTFEINEKINFNITQKSVNNFEEKVKCFVEQYGMQKESLTNIKKNDILTLNEIIADNGGLKVAHRAYMKWLQSNGGKDRHVIGFDDFTNEQLFFIGYGRKLCEYRSKDNLEKQIKTGKHTPAEIRTNVALSNYKPFLDAFKCPANGKMNPKEKCG
uniref:Phosphate-regulating neutral endopeptidase (inferred by orthology to a human protein) n=1 Tax=Strongyloides venezuelensis TaxID=75913 RepID=A0A0K0EW49_STRVS